MHSSLPLMIPHHSTSFLSVVIASDNLCRSSMELFAGICCVSAKVVVQGCRNGFFRKNFEGSVTLFKSLGFRTVSGARLPQKDPQFAVRLLCGIPHALVNHCSLLQFGCKGQASMKPSENLFMNVQNHLEQPCCHDGSLNAPIFWFVCQ